MPALAAAPVQIHPVQYRSNLCGRKQCRSLSAPISEVSDMCQEKLAQLLVKCELNETSRRITRSFSPSILVLAAQHSVPEVNLMCPVAKCVAAIVSLFFVWSWVMAVVPQASEICI